MTTDIQYDGGMAVSEHTTDGPLLLQESETLDPETRARLIDAALDSILTEDAELLERLADA